MNNKLFRIFRKHSVFAILLLVTFTFGEQIIAQTSWKGTASSYWSNSSNWTAGVPTASVDAIIGDANFTGSYQPSITSSSSCKSLTIGAGSKSSTLTLGSQSKNLTVSGSVTIGAVGTITQSQSNTITLSGNFSKFGTYNATNSSAKVTFSGISQTISGSSTIVFKRLTINSSSTTTLQVNCTVTTLTVSGVLNPGESSTYQITSISTLTVNSTGTLQVRATTFTGNYSASTVSLSAGSTVEYASTTRNQTVSNSYTYSTLRISGAMTKSITGNLPALNSSSSTYGKIFVDGGTFDISSYTVNRGTSVMGGSFSVANGATFKIGGLNSFPINYSTISLGTSSTVEYSGTNQTVTTLSYGHLTLSSSSGSAIKTMQASAMVIAGNLTSSTGAGTSVSFTAGNLLTVNGNISIGASTTFNGATFTHTLLGDWTNNGTFTGSTSKVVLIGTYRTISGTGVNNFYDLEIGGSGINVSGTTNISVAGNLTTVGAGTFTHSVGGTLTMSGTSKKINGSGITLANLIITGSVTDSTSLTISGNLLLSGSGSFNAVLGTITLSGPSNMMTNSGSGSFILNALTVTGNITTSSDFSIRGNFAVPSGSFTATAGRVTFIGSTTISGTVNIFNGTLNGILLQLGGNSVLGCAGDTPTLVAGTFDPTTYTPNTVNYNGTSAQVIVPVTYYNLTFTNGGLKSTIGPMTVTNHLTINAGATFNAGSYTHIVHGDWINNGTFISSTGTIEFAGSNDEYVSGSSSTAFNTLTLNKSFMESKVILSSSVNVATLNMTSGKIYIPDTTKSITITTTRTGNGVIEGTITRTHTFINGIFYAFEGPTNFIRFTGGGINPTSITIRVVMQAPPDFVPKGTSGLEMYTISQIGGSGYTATLCLSYEAEALNGNDPAMLHLYKYVAGSWIDCGETSSDIPNQCVELSGVTDIIGRWTFMSSISGTLEWIGALSSDWDNSYNWSVVNGTPSIPPDSATYVQLGFRACTNQPTITSVANARIISFGAEQGITLTLSSGGSLNIEGSFGYSGSWTSDITHTIVIGNQTMTIGGDLNLGPTVNNRRINMTISNGSLSVDGHIDQTTNSEITVNGSGTILIKGNWLTSGSATFTCGSGSVIYNGSGSQIVAPWTYYHLDIRKPSGNATLSANAVVAGNLDVDSTGGYFQIAADTLSVSGNVTIAAGNTFDAGSAIIRVGGNWTTNGTFAPAGSTLTFNGSGTQTLTSGNINRLIIAKSSGTFSPSGNLITTGSFTITSGTVDLSTHTISRSSFGGTVSMGAGSLLKMGTGSNIPSNFSTYIFDSTSTQEFYGTDAQPIVSATYGNLTLTNGSTTAKVLNGHIAVKGNLLVNSSASLNAGSYNATINGNWINNGTFTPGTGSILLSGSSKTLSSSGNLDLYNLSVGGSYTFSAPQMHIRGDADVMSGTLNVGTTTMILDGNITLSGTLYTDGIITVSGTRAQTIQISSPIVGTVNNVLNFNGTVRPSLNTNAAPTFGTVNINNTGGIVASANWSVYGPLTIAAASSFDGGYLTHTFYRSVNNQGILTSEGNLNFLPMSTSIIRLSGVAFNSRGRVTFGGTGSTTIVGTAPIFQNVNILNTNAVGITLPSGWTIVGDLSIGSGATFHAGTGIIDSIAGSLTCDGIFDGGTSTIVMSNATLGEIGGGGTINFYNVKIAGTITAMSDFNVGGSFTYDGIFDGSAVDVYFTGNTPSTITGTQATPSFPSLINMKSNATTTLGMNLVDIISLIDSTGTLNLSTYTLTQDAGGGILSIDAGATLQIGGTNSMPTFNTYDLHSLSTVEYNGSGAQTVSTMTYGGLKINNTNGVTLAGSTTVNGTLTFASGKITTGANNLIIGSSGSVSGASVGKYVYGNLQKLFSPGAQSFTFDVGDATNYTPAAISFANVSTPGNVTAKTTSGDHLNISTSGINSSKSVNRYWTLTAGGGLTYSMYDAAFTFINPGDIDVGSTPGNYTVKRYNGSSWSSPTIGTRTSTTTGVTNVSAMSDYAIGEPLSPIITSSAGSNGSISPTPTAIVNYGGSQTFTITPSTGYHVDSLIVDGVKVTSA
ncbi:MAG: hypothetical protein HZB59_12900, partial [Ignavibacteriales bacterium]|nr:hypothetical protein [Ignavibacteriales bacterium]